jgi:hypothetical protein
MSEFDGLFKRVEQLAKEEGLFDADARKPKRALPDPRETELDLAKAQRVIERLAAERSTEARPLSFVPVTQVNPEILPKPHDIGLAKPMSAVDDEQDVQSSKNAEIVVQEQLQFLSKWHDINAAPAKKDLSRYWVLKVPALLSTVSVSAFEAFGYGQVVIVMGVVAAFCVGIDAAFPGGQLHNIHKRAANEIRRLQHDVITKWRHAQLGSRNGLAPAAQALLSEIQAVRAKIDTYVTEAEASLGKTASAQSDN